MNKERRKKLEDLLEQLSTIKDEITELAAAEQEAFDNLPESLQEGERGQQMEGNVEILEDAVGNIEEIDEWLQEIVGG